MSVTTALAEQRVCLADVPWNVYVSLSDGSRMRRSIMAYDRGVLEIMSPGVRHEDARHLISRIIETWAEVREIDIRGVASGHIPTRRCASGF